MKKPTRMTAKRWRRIRRRREAHAEEVLLCQLLREIFLEEAFEKAIAEAVRREEEGDTSLTPGEQEALERSRVKLMASLRYHQAEGCFQKPIERK